MSASYRETLEKTLADYKKKLENHPMKKSEERRSYTDILTPEGLLADVRKEFPDTTSAGIQGVTAFLNAYKGAGYIPCPPRRLAGYCLSWMVKKDYAKEGV